MSDIWSDVDKFVDAFGKISRLADLREELREANNIDKKICGNCYWWMKSKECPREHNVNGYSRGPSCNDYGCDKFVLTQSTINRKVSRLKEINAELAALNAVKEKEMV